jgi:hypothetical protein
MSVTERFRGAYLGAVLGDLIGAVWPQLERRNLNGLMTSPIAPHPGNGRLAAWGRQNLMLRAALADWQDLASIELQEQLEGVMPPMPASEHSSSFAAELARSLCCSLPLMLFFHDVPAQLRGQLAELTRQVAQTDGQEAVQVYLQWVSDRLTHNLRQAALAHPHLNHAQGTLLNRERTIPPPLDRTLPATIAPLITIANRAMQLAPASPPLALVRSLQLYDQHLLSIGAELSSTQSEQYRSLGMTMGATMGSLHGLSGWPIPWQLTLMMRFTPIMDAEWGLSSSAMLLALVDQLAIAWAGSHESQPMTSDIAIAAAQVLQPR